MVWLCFLFLNIVLAAGARNNLEDGSTITNTTSFSSLSRLDFPPGFVFGAGTSAYQVEGAVAEDGRKPSVLDTFVHRNIEFLNGTADVASDQYHKYKDDVKMMHKIGLDAYRFSISWSRIIPDGRGAINPKGLSYYNNLINELLRYGIEPHVTLIHFDYPQALEDEYGGMESVKFIEDFTAYADVCFKEYGDRVKSWITINEPNLVGNPLNCTDDTKTPKALFIGHNKLVAHATVVQLYRTKYQEKQKGQIGITLYAQWHAPATTSPLDIVEAKQQNDFEIGWFMDPLVYGRYYAANGKIFGSPLSSTTDNDLKLIKGSYDFIGLNHYFVIYVRGLPTSFGKYGNNYRGDLSTNTSLPPGEWGLYKLLEYVKEKYNNPTVLIHENGLRLPVDDPSDPTTHNDMERIDYFKRYTQTLLQSIRDGSNVKGYFVWSLVDCFEYFSGYSMRYGLYGVDFNDKNRRRYPRESAHWYSRFLAKSGGKLVDAFNYLKSE